MVSVLGAEKRPLSRGVAHLGDALPGQLVGALIQVVPRMSAHPVPLYLMLAESGLEPLPEIDILDRLLVRGAPAVAFPVRHPGHDAVAQILAVGVNIDA